MKTSSHKALLQRTNINCHSNLSTIRALVRLTSNPLELNILYTGAEEAADKLFYKTVGELFDTGILCNFQSWIWITGTQCADKSKIVHQNWFKVHFLLGDRWRFIHLKLKCIFWNLSTSHWQVSRPRHNSRELQAWQSSQLTNQSV